MVPWRELGRATVGAQPLVLAQRGDEFAIRLRGAELMNSRLHASEDALARLGCAALTKLPHARVLVGGLGMGFTLRAALDALRADAQVTVVELVPEVVAWNREHLGHLARQPLSDPRVRVEVRDVVDAIRNVKQPWHAILLDVDNGPDAFTAPSNAALYGFKGLHACRKALAPGGTLSVWSVQKDHGFTDRFKAAGFAVEYHFVPSRPGSKIMHVVWVGKAEAAGAPARGSTGDHRRNSPRRR